jgi:glycine/D-amino acid oxidase-like deaminating enzyme
MRVAVIGSGVVGSSVGWHLARRGARVVMIDAGPPGTGVSHWTFSWVNASNKTQTRSYFDLNVAGLAAHRELAAELGPGDWWHPTGHLRWSDDQAGSDALHRAVHHLQSWGYEVSLWEADKVRRLLEPEVCFPSADTAVACYGEEGWIDGRRLVARFIDDALRHGAQTHFGAAVTDVAVKGSRVAAVVLSDGVSIEVDAVVNAAGPGANDVARLVGRTLPMRHEPGLVARVRCHRVPVGRAMHAPRVEIRPDGDDRVVLHSRQIDDQIDDLSASTGDAADLTARLHRLGIDAVPSLRTSELIESRVSSRPIPADGFPSVGGIEGLTGYYEAVTHSGITLGVIVGRLLAVEILDAAVDTLLEPYRPSRFAN